MSRIVLRPFAAACVLLSGAIYNAIRENWQAARLRLLLAMTPVIAVYTYWSAQWSSRNYIADLKRETRATTRALAPVVSGYIQRAQWREVHQMLQRMSADGTEGAV